MNTNRSEHQVVSDILKELQAVVKREGRRHMMDQHLTFSLLELLEEEIIPMLENELDFDPTPQYLYDNDGGEAAISSGERHDVALKQHIALHS
jgi:hypothetical protein